MKPALTDIGGRPAIQQALSSTRGAGSSRDRRTPVAHERVARGDIRVAAPLPWVEGRRRLAVVRRVDPDREVADMLLMHTHPELATDNDAILKDPGSGVSYPLVVECSVRGPVWLLQLGERVGVLTEQQLDAIGSAVVDGEPAIDGVHSGLPLAGPADPRWAFKEQEVGEWRAISDDCAGALLADDDPWAIEPTQLPPYTHEDSSEAVSNPRPHLRDSLQIEEAIHIIATRRASVDLQGTHPATLDLECWVKELGRDVGLAAFTAFQPTLHAALTRQDSSLLQEVA